MESQTVPVPELYYLQLLFVLLIVTHCLPPLSDLLFLRLPGKIFGIINHWAHTSPKQGMLSDNMYTFTRDLQIQYLHQQTANMPWFVTIFCSVTKKNVTYFYIGTWYLRQPAVIFWPSSLIFGSRIRYQTIFWFYSNYIRSLLLNWGFHSRARMMVKSKSSGWRRAVASARESLSFADVCLSISFEHEENWCSGNPN